LSRVKINEPLEVAFENKSDSIQNALEVIFTFKNQQDALFSFMTSVRGLM
jgi:hypothetical protein